MSNLVLCANCGKYWTCRVPVGILVECDWFVPKPATSLNGFGCRGCP